MLTQYGFAIADALLAPKVWVLLAVTPVGRKTFGVGWPGYMEALEAAFEA